MTSELKPCPFCGGTKVVVDYVRDGKQAHCHNCGASAPPKFHGPADQPSAEERAITAWNTRQSTNTIETQAKVIEKFSDKMHDQAKQIEELVGALNDIKTLSGFRHPEAETKKIKAIAENALTILAKHNKGEV